MLVLALPNSNTIKTHTLTFFVCVLKNFNCRAIAMPCYRRHFTLFVVSLPHTRYDYRVMRKKTTRAISFAHRRERWVIAAWVLSIWEGEWKIKKKEVWRYRSMRDRTVCARADIFEIPTAMMADTKNAAQYKRYDNIVLYLKFVSDTEAFWYKNI